MSLTPLTLDVTDGAGLDRLRQAHPLDAALAAQVSAPVSSPGQAEAVRQDEAAVAPRRSRSAARPAANAPASGRGSSAPNTPASSYGVVTSS